MDDTNFREDTELATLWIKCPLCGLLTLVRNNRGEEECVNPECGEELCSETYEDF